MNELHSTLLPIFLEEAGDNLKGILGYFQSFKTDRDGDRRELEQAWRCAHTLKGAAGLVRLPRIRELAETLENGLEALLDSQGRPPRARVESLFAALKEMAAQIKAVRAGAAGVPALSPEAAPGLAAREAPEIVAPAAPLSGEVGAPALPAATGEGEASSLQAAPENVCCRFRAGHQEYFLDMKDMAEIAGLPRLVPLPLAPSYILGLISLRGAALPVVDLASLSAPLGRTRPAGHLVVGQAGNERIGFFADDLPSLSPETAGVRVDLKQFVQRFAIKASG
ncbi:chemotaxis protein CheW [Geoalkalibacter sp.]|uniref:chemotaxis protein CheW n=1 Tax=Geoalkalibacter sp. TaxID=3041440 RepID=UPI00272E927A|nr:chemotaxis protein CheW [Geoalkalibacter sp.]